MEGQHWCSIVRMAWQQAGPRLVSPLRKNKITSPLHACSSSKESQHFVDSSHFSLASRLDFGGKFGRAMAVVEIIAIREVKRNSLSVEAMRLCEIEVGMRFGEKLAGL